MVKLVIAGGGAWGTALAIALHKKHTITLWLRDQNKVSALVKNRLNPYLPEVALPAHLSITADLNLALADADALVIALPAQGFEAFLEALRPMRWQKTMIAATKGMGDRFPFLPDAATATLPGTPFLLLSGPSFALEVAKGLPTAVTLAGPLELAAYWANVLATSSLRIYHTDDILGVALAGTYKNVLAIAAGMSDGLNLGLNARAALCTRGLAELRRLGRALGAKEETLMGLSGIGDIILTTTGDLSRNRQVGILLGEGRRLSEILSSLGHVAEGVRTAPRMMALAQNYHIEMPIVEVVCAVLEGRLAPASAAAVLMARELKAEVL